MSHDQNFRESHVTVFSDVEWKNRGRFVQGISVPGAAGHKLERYNWRTDFHRGHHQQMPTTNGKDFALLPYTVVLTLGLVLLRRRARAKCH